jgi:hypothetical protein
MIWEDVSAAIEGGTFETRSDRHLSRSALELDETGWKELSQLLAGVLDEAEKIEARSAERIKEGPDEEAVPTRVVIMHFESPHAQQS